MGVVEADDVAAEFRQFQPLRHLALEHAAFAPIIARAATFAGDHQDELGAIALRLAQEGQQRRMRLAAALAAGTAARAGGRGWAADFALLDAAAGGGSADAGGRRSGATERVKWPQSVRSSSRRRRGLPSPALMIAAAIARDRPAGAIFSPWRHPRSCPPAAWPCPPPS